MNLKPMSLNQKGQQQQDLTRQSDMSNAYITPGNDEDPPMLELGKYDDLNLYSFRDIYLLASRTDPHNPRRCFERNSNYSISEIFQSCSTFSKSDSEHIEEFNDVLILGILCKSLCRLDIPAISIIAEYTSLFEQFVKETLDYYYAGIDHYTFNVSRALKLVSKEMNQYIDSGNSYAKYFLSGEVQNKKAVRLALLEVNQNLIRVTTNLSDYHELVVPLSITKSNLKDVLLDYLYDSLIWILLAKTGFIVYKSYSFHLLEGDVNSEPFNHSIDSEYTEFDTILVNHIFRKNV